MLANTYLHYALDLWAQQWRRRQVRGDMIIVRYADDIVFDFQSRAEAERFLAELRERLFKFNLELNEAKTRLVEFGRYADENRRRRGERKPESLNFLGFTHLCGRKRNGKFVVLRHTMRKRQRSKCRQLKQELKRRMYLPVPNMGRWLQSVLRGHYNYYGVIRNGRAMNAFRYNIGNLWFKVLRRRSQKARLNWKRMARIIERHLPYPKIRQPYPEQRLRVVTQGRSPVR